VLTLKGLKKEFEVDGRKYVVKVDGGAVEEDRGGRKLLRIKITAEVGGVRREYQLPTAGMEEIARLRALPTPAPTAHKEADAERLAAVVKALTGRGRRCAV
jgi:hypothetical protein